MASFATLASTTAYLTLLTQINDRDIDLAKGLDPAYATAVTSPPTNAVRYSSANKRWETYNGSAWVELIVAATDAYNITVTGLRGGNIYGSVTNGGTITGGTVNATTLQAGGSAAWTAASLTNLNQLTNGPAFTTLAAVAAVGYAPIATPTFTGVPAAPTAAVDTSTTQIATTAYVVGQSYLKAATAATTYATLAGATLTGVPTAPTAAVDTNTTQIATTAYVVGNGYLKSATAATTYAALAGATFVGAVNGTSLTLSGDIQQANATYVKGKNGSGTATRILGISASNILNLGSLDTTLSGGMVYSNNGVQQFIVDSSGNFGVGSTAPAHRFDLGSASGTVRARFSGIMIGNAASGYPSVGYNASPASGSTWTYDIADNASWIQFNGAATKFFIGSGGGTGAAITPVQYLHVDSSANLGIGNAAPGYKVEVTGNLALKTSSNPYLYLIDTNGAGHAYSMGTGGSAYSTGVFGVRDETLSAIRVVIDATGQVGINKTTPTRTLEVSGGAMTSPQAVAFSATPTFNASLGNLFVLGNLTANVTSMTISNAVEGQFLAIRVRQDATGGRTVAVPGGASVAGAVNSTANKTSYLNLTYNATDARWDGSWTQIP